MADKTENQTCKKCGRRQRFEYSVSDTFWARLPEKWHDKCLCIECFLEEMDETLEEDVVFGLPSVRFMGVVGDKIKARLFDAELKCEEPNPVATAVLVAHSDGSGVTEFSHPLPMLVAANYFQGFVMSMINAGRRQIMNTFHRFKWEPGKVQTGVEIPEA